MKIRVCIIIIIFTLCFIWGNSALPSKQSNFISNDVTTVAGGTITDTATQEAEAQTWLTSSHIRKLAHVFEYSVLGVEVMILCAFVQKPIKKHLSTLALFGLLVALFDETIQLFNDRTSMVSDIWIDMVGFALGICLSWLIWRLLRKRKRNLGNAS